MQCRGVCGTLLGYARRVERTVRRYNPAKQLGHGHGYAACVLRTKTRRNKGDEFPFRSCRRVGSADCTYLKVMERMIVVHSSDERDERAQLPHHIVRELNHVGVPLTFSGLRIKGGKVNDFLYFIDNQAFTNLEMKLWPECRAVTCFSTCHNLLDQFRHVIHIPLNQAASLLVDIDVDNLTIDLRAVRKSWLQLWTPQNEIFVSFLGTQNEFETTRDQNELTQYVCKRPFPFASILSSLGITQ